SIPVAFSHHQRCRMDVTTKGRHNTRRKKDVRVFFHVYVESYSSERVGARTKQVRCERCGANYEYRCVRRTVGQGGAVFGIGAAEAQQQADYQADRLLELRLSQGIDPVPCPACGWVQQAMVNELNRHRHRWMVGVGVAVIGVSLI